MSFFRMSESEAKQMQNVKWAATIEGVPIYLHTTLAEHFTLHPLILGTRGPRLVIEKDQALCELESGLLRNLDLSEQDETR